MKEFLLAATGLIVVLYVGKKLSQGEPVVKSPSPQGVKAGDKVRLADGSVFAVLEARDPLLIALRSPYTDPANRAEVPLSQVIEVLPRTV